MYILKIYFKKSLYASTKEASWFLMLLIAVFACHCFMNLVDSPLGTCGPLIKFIKTHLSNYLSNFKVVTSHH